MDTPILVAKVLGIYLTISGLFLLVKGRTLPHLLRDFFGHPAIVYLAGAILVFLSSMYLLNYNVWDSSWKTIITFFVWIVLLKGLVYIFAPKALSEMAIERNKSMFKVYGVIAVALGLYLFFLN